MTPLPRLTTLLFSAALFSISPAHAQADLGVAGELDITISDLAPLFRARPPMGDCPVGETDETAHLPEGSHLLHLGVPRFFLNYQLRLQLTTDQISQLKDAREAALATWQAHQQDINALELQMWQQTGVPHPAMDEVEATILRIEQVRAAQRLAYVQAVLNASAILTADQREALVGVQGAAK